MSKQNRPPTNVDLIIIGGGPAGLSTALHLIQKDPSWAGRMILLEKSAHPRPKLCGGGITRFGFQILAGLGFTFPLPIPQALVEDVHLKYARRSVHVHGRPVLTIFHRPEFDAFLAGEARRGEVALHENEPLLNICPEADGIRVSTPTAEYRTQVVVGADGALGPTRRILTQGGQRGRVARPLEVLLPATDSAPQFACRYACFDFSAAQQGLQGYTWNFPVWVDGKPTFNCGVYDARMATHRQRAELPGLLSAALEADGLAFNDRPAAGHPIHWWSPRAKMSGPRWLLVGEAAGIDSLFGEGIAPALGYGQVAAQAIQAAFTRQDFSFSDYRRRFRSSPVGRYLFLRWAAAWGSYRLSGHAGYMHLVWTIGKFLARAWPALPDLYGEE